MNFGYINKIITALQAETVDGTLDNHVLYLCDLAWHVGMGPNTYGLPIAATWIASNGSPTNTIDAALKTVPEGWWWHMSHLEVSVTPTHDIMGGLMSNPTLRNGDRPANFSVMMAKRHELARSLCAACLKARRALSLPDPMPIHVSRLAFKMLSEANPQITDRQWRKMEVEYRSHWLALALAAWRKVH